MGEGEKRNELARLIKTGAAGHGDFCVDARDVHKFVEAKTPFAHWWRRRVADNDGKIGVDYILEKSIGNPNTVPVSPVDKNDHANSKGVTETGILGMVPFQPDKVLVTLRLAGLMCMGENTKRGLECRDWFWNLRDECQRLKYEATQPRNLSRMDLIQLAFEAEKAFQESEARAKQLEGTVKETTQKVVVLEQAIVKEKVESIEARATADRCESADGCYSPTEVARQLKVPPHTFIAACDLCGILSRDRNYSDTGTYTPWILQGYLVKKVHIDENQKSRPYVQFTEKGIPWARKRILKYRLMDFPLIPGYMEDLQKLGLGPVRTEAGQTLTDAYRAAHAGNAPDYGEMKRLKELALDWRDDGGHINVLGGAGPACLSAPGDVPAVQSQAQPAAPVVDTPAF